MWMAKFEYEARRRLGRSSFSAFNGILFLATEPLGFREL